MRYQESLISSDPTISELLPENEYTEARPDKFYDWRLKALRSAYNKRHGLMGNPKKK